MELIAYCESTELPESAVAMLEAAIRRSNGNDLSRLKALLESTGHK
jgi:hypothetical protein